MEAIKYTCDICGTEVKTTLGGNGNDKKILLELWEVYIRRVTPENVSLSQHFRGDAHEGKSGQVCSACLTEWYPEMKFNQPKLTEVAEQ